MRKSNVLYARTRMFMQWKYSLLPIALCLSLDVVAQLEIGPLPPPVASRPASSARMQNSTPLELPFWDDFSSVNTALSHAPDTAFWVNSRSVFVGSGDGYLLPSVNSGVFNGLDSLGSPYNNEPTATGFNDKLVSRKIRMSAVPVNMRNTVYLSFFFQWKGNGEAPDDNDFLRIEFLDLNGKWVNIESIYGDDEAYDDSVFYIHFVPVTGTEYYHDDFQFRLRNYGRASGPYDTWTVDYFYLNSGRDGANSMFPDRAAASQLSPMIGLYTGVPYSHFLLDKSLDSALVDVINLRTPYPIPASVNYQATAYFVNYQGEDPPVESTVTIVPSSPVGTAGGLMFPGERITIKLDNLPDPDDATQFNPSSDSVDVKILVELISGDETDPAKGPFDPVDFTRNDTTSSNYYFRNYYSYDDGVAEYSAGLTQPGNRLAYRFDMLIDTATLYGVYVYFPYSGGPSTQTVDFFLYGDDGGVPSSVPLASFLSRTITKNGENRFFFIRFAEPVFVSGGTFYFGWKEPTSSRLKVGLDKNSNTNEKIYVYVNGSWTNDTDVRGSLMIRPYFGKGSGVITGDEEITNRFEPYPNPSSGSVFLPPSARVQSFTTLDGRPVAYQLETEADRIRLTLPEATRGLFILRWQLNQRAIASKIVVTQ